MTITKAAIHYESPNLSLLSISTSFVPMTIPGIGPIFGTCVHTNTPPVRSCRVPPVRSIAWTHLPFLGRAAAALFALGRVGVVAAAQSADCPKAAVERTARSE